MAASRLVFLVLLLVFSTSLSAMAHATVKPLSICSALSCVIRDGTQCDRTNHECLRCLMVDPLLDVPICTNLASDGRTCPQNATLCPETPLDTGGSNEWVHLPTTPVPESRSLRPSVQPAIANNAPMPSMEMEATNSSSSKLPTWSIALIGAVALLVVSLLFMHLYLKRRERKRLQESTILTPPLSKQQREGTVPTPQEESPLSIYSVEIATIDPKRIGPSARIQSTTTASELGFSCGPDSYRRHDSAVSTHSDILLFSERKRSVSIDDIDIYDGEEWNTTTRSRRNVPVLSSQPSFASDDEIDIYPDTSVTRPSLSGPMFSPQTRRTQYVANFTTFSIHDDEDDEAPSEPRVYPDTSVALDVVSVWDSHRQDQETTHEQQRVTAWKAKYDTQEYM